MTPWWHPARTRGRVLAFYAVLALPLLRHLVRVGYPWWTAEVAVLLAGLALPAFLLGYVTRRPRWFQNTFVLWLAWASASGIASAWFLAERWMPTGQWLVLASGAVVVIGAASFVFQERLVPLTLVLLGGMLAAETGLAATTWFESRAPRVVASPPSAHVIHVVFDGQIGIRGFPKHVPEAAAAAALWQETLLRHKFTVFPYAYSNYDETLDSVPSILNDRLESLSHEFVGPRSVVASNGRLADASAHGMAVTVYQSDFLRFVRPENRWRVREYAAGAPLPLPSSVASLWERVEILGAWYATFDKVSSVLLNRLPADVRLSPNLWPLNAERLWPNVLEADILEAKTPTYFFAHFLLPHAPFAFDAHGTLRPRRKWRSWPAAELKPDPYDALYAEYADQSAFIARQLSAFLDSLSAAGVLDKAKVIIHGDHGTRFRRVDDGTGDPAAQSARLFVDAFSTMLAVRQPGAVSGKLDPTQGGILRLLRMAEGREEAATAADAQLLDTAYGFRVGEGEGKVRRFEGRDYWKDAQ